MVESILEDKLMTLAQRVKNLEEKVISQNQTIKLLQNKLNCLEIDEVIKLNEKY